MRRRKRTTQLPRRTTQLQRRTTRQRGRTRARSRSRRRGQSPSSRPRRKLPPPPPPEPASPLITAGTWIYTAPRHAIATPMPGMQDYAQAQVGYKVVGRGTVVAVLGAFCAAILAAGLWLLRRGPAGIPRPRGRWPGGGRGGRVGGHRHRCPSRRSAHPCHRAPRAGGGPPSSASGGRATLTSTAPTVAAGPCGPRAAHPLARHGRAEGAPGPHGLDRPRSMGVAEPVDAGGQTPARAIFLNGARSKAPWP